MIWSVRAVYNAPDYESAVEFKREMQRVIDAWTDRTVDLGSVAEVAPLVQPPADEAK